MDHTHEPHTMTDAPRLAVATDTLMHAEATQAADVVAAQVAHKSAVIAALAEDLRLDPLPFVVTCAHSSSDPAATYAKYLFEAQWGLVAASAPPSVGSVHAATQQLRGALYPVISQSGQEPRPAGQCRSRTSGGAGERRLFAIGTTCARGHSAACGGRAQRCRHQKLLGGHNPDVPPHLNKVTETV